VRAGYRRCDGECAGDFVGGEWGLNANRDEISPVAIFHLALLPRPCLNGPAMVAHDEPVRSRGLWPCGRIILPTTTCVSAGGGCAPRPPGTGRGTPEVQTFRNIAFKLAYGRRQIRVGVAERKATNELRPSHAAASAARTLAMAPSYEGNYCGGSGGFVRETSLPRMMDDLGTAVQ